MTDNEIKNALKHCVNEDADCESCPLYDFCNDNTFGLVQNVFDLIVRQQAEIERLKKTQRIEIHIDKEFYNECQYEIKQAKSEAIKEFADRLKKRMRDSHFQNYGLAILEIINLVKEMTEV